MTSRTVHWSGGKAKAVQGAIFVCFTGRSSAKVTMYGGREYRVLSVARVRWVLFAVRDDVLGGRDRRGPLEVLDSAIWVSPFWLSTDHLCFVPRLFTRDHFISFFRRGVLGSFSFFPF